MIKAPRATILVVDDYEDVLILLRRWLEALDCRVLEARDGREAVEAAVRERPDLILMDLFLPEIDGFTAAAQIRHVEHLSDVPIVAISAYGELGIDAQLRHDSMASGFNVYVPKPFDIQRLGQLIAEFCGPARIGGREQ